MDLIFFRLSIYSWSSFSKSNQLTMHKHDSRTFGIYANVALIIEKREIEGKGRTKENLFFCFKGKAEQYRSHTETLYFLMSPRLSCRKLLNRREQLEPESFFFLLKMLFPSYSSSFTAADVVDDVVVKPCINIPQKPPTSFRRIPSY